MSTLVSPDSIRSSVVLPAPLRPDRVIRSRRSSLNEIPRSNGSPEMSLPRSDAMTTAMPLMVGAAERGATSVSLPLRCLARTRIRRFPPRGLPPARTVVVEGRGEFFLRDTDPTAAAGDDRPVVVLLHGWLVTADLNWHTAYGPLSEAGYRVIALDHRGHGRGLRPLVPFRLADCAADVAALLRTLRLGPATVVGYSMGGTIAQLVARDHSDVVSGLVLSATCQHFQDPDTQRVWKWMGAAGVAMGLAPQQFFAAGLRRAGLARGSGHRLDVVRAQAPQPQGHSRGRP